MSLASRFKAFLAPPEQKGQFDAVLRNLMVAYETVSGIAVTPDNCMRAPTVQAVVTAIARRISISSLGVYQQTTSDGRTKKELLPNHPVARLLKYPNDWQSKVNYWTDAVSSRIRTGNYIAYKGRGQTGPIRFLQPLYTSSVSLDRNADVPIYKVSIDGGYREYTRAQIHHVRGPARDFMWGDSPIMDVRESIALEIAAEQFGASFFGNGAMPLLVFKLMEGMREFKTDQEKKLFLSDVKDALGGSKKFSTFMLPKGMDLDAIQIDNEKTQLVDVRKHIRTVICGALGVPPHLVGDLERATFNNVEQQDLDFISNVVQPIAMEFESAMERDLLTDDDRAQGVIIRFNLDSILRGDFKSRQEGLQIQRQNGVISPNEWREFEGKNPIGEDDGGDDYIYPANMTPAGQPPEPPPAAPTPKPTENDVAKNVRASLSELKSLVKEPTKPAEVHNYFDITLPPQNNEINVTPNVGVDLKIDRQSITTGTTNVNVDPATVTVNADVKSPDVRVEAPTIDIGSPTVTVNNPPAEVTVKNEVQPASVTVLPAEVTIENKVETPQVIVHNDVEAPLVTIKNEVEVPATIVNVEQPDITVEAPEVTVKNVLPESEVTEQKVVRDDKGRIEKTVTTRKRK